MALHTILLLTVKYTKGFHLQVTQKCTQNFWYANNMLSGNHENGIQPWRRGIVVIASGYRTEDPGFEYRQGARFLGIYHCSSVVNHN
jgi:hypothetical protein